VKAKLCAYLRNGTWTADPVGIKCIAFGGKGDAWVATVGCGASNMITLYDWKSSQMLCNVEVKDDAQVLAAAFNPSDASLVTVGVNHVTFWTFMKGKLSGVEGTWGDKGQPRTLESIEFACRGELNVCLTGTIDGRVCVWSVKGVLLSMTGFGHARGVSSLAFDTATGACFTPHVASSDGHQSTLMVKRGIVIASFTSPSSCCNQPARV